jgi:hypothetical protein
MLSFWSKVLSFDNERITRNVFDFDNVFRNNSCSELKEIRNYGHCMTVLLDMPKYLHSILVQFTGVDPGIFSRGVRLCQKNSTLDLFLSTTRNIQIEKKILFPISQNPNPGG